jgi:hypothetical protein
MDLTAEQQAEKDYTILAWPIALNLVKKLRDARGSPDTKRMEQGLDLADTNTKYS